MSGTRGVAAVTGAYGYLGALLRHRLAADGWSTRALVRSPRPGDESFRWALGEVPDRRTLEGATALIHCAYDFAPRSFEGLWRANVSGTEALLEAASGAGVSRIIVLSSMSAYRGTRQRYGRVKLAIEERTLRAGGVVVRPGLVYGRAPRGMAGALMKLASLPVVPVPGGSKARQFPVHEDDFAAGVLALVKCADWRSDIVGLAQAQSIGFGALLRHFAREQGKNPLLVEVPWRPVYAGLRLAETLRLPLPVRPDSLLGLVRPAPLVPVSTLLPDFSRTVRELRET
jgi:nucleoside-diphosphate-sugar epimerase